MIDSIATCTHSTDTQAGSQTVLLLPVVHLRIRAKEILAEVLNSSETAAAQSLKQLVTEVWGQSTAVEIMDSAQELFQPRDFMELRAWVNSHYPILHAIWEQQQAQPESGKQGDA